MTRKKSKKQEISPKGFSSRSRDSFAVVEGQEAFASRWKYKLEIVRHAKKSGCPGFLAGNRIDPILAIPAINEMVQKTNKLPDGIATPQDWLATEKAKREMIKRQVDEKSVMPTADAERQSAEACAFIDSELQRGENELPPVLAGLSAVECGKLLHNFTERLRKNAKRKFEEVGK